MDRLINAILKLSREGRREFRRSRIDLGAIWSQASSATVAAPGRRAPAPQVRVERALPDIVSDRLALEQIFGNLIDNAVKYLKPGRPGASPSRGRSELGVAILSRSPTMAAASIRRRPRAHLRAVPPRRRARTSRARASASPMSARWCAVSAARSPCRSDARRRRPPSLSPCPPTWTRSNENAA